MADTPSQTPDASPRIIDTCKVRPISRQLFAMTGPKGRGYCRDARYLGYWRLTFGKGSAFLTASDRGWSVFSAGTNTVALSVEMKG